MLNVKKSRAGLGKYFHLVFDFKIDQVNFKHMRKFFRSYFKDQICHVEFHATMHFFKMTLKNI